MNEELLNQLLGRFQDFMDNINNVIKNSSERINNVNSILKSISSGNFDELKNIENLNIDAIKPSVTKLLTSVRNFVEVLKKSSGDLSSNYESLTELLSKATDTAFSSNQLRKSLNNLSQTTKEYAEPLVPEKEQPTKGGNEGEPPNIDENAEVTGENPQNYLFTEPAISTASLPYQDIALLIRRALLQPLERLGEAANELGLKFESLTGGLSKQDIQRLRDNNLMSTFDSMLYAMNAYAGRIYEAGVNVDEAINLAFAGRAFRSLKGKVPEETYTVLAESVARNQFANLREAAYEFTNTIGLVMQDLGHLQRTSIIKDFPLNVGSPEFYKGFLGLPVEYGAVPSDQMGIILSELQKEVGNAVGVFARQLFPEQSFQRTSALVTKGFGISYFTSEAYESMINLLKERFPEKYEKIKPYVEEAEKFTFFEELNQSFTRLRTTFNEIGLKEITEPTLMKDLVDTIKPDTFNQFLDRLNQIGNLRGDASKAFNHIRNFVKTLSDFEKTGQVPSKIDVEPLINSIRVLSDYIENQVNKYFKTEFPQYIGTLSSMRKDFLKLGEPEKFASFLTMTDSLRRITDKLGQVEGRVGFFDRYIRLPLKSTLEEPASHMLRMNVTNLQWALMLGLSSSIMDIMTRPAYETVYTSVTPVYTAIGNLTGLMPLFSAFQSFPHQIQQMASMLQTSLNSISALLGSRFYSIEAVRVATEISRVQPIQLPQAIEVLTAISTYPSTRPYASNTEFQRKIFDVVQLLSLLAPEQGVGGALFAIREALGGQWRSLQMRFNISPEVLAQYANVTPEKMRTATGEELIKNLYKGLTTMFGGERVLLQKGAQLDVQIQNIVDTLISGLVLPLVSQQNKGMIEMVDKWLSVKGESNTLKISDFENNLVARLMPQQYQMLKELAEKQSKETGESRDEVMARLARETWGTPIGALSGMVAMINNAISDILGSMGLSDVVSNLILDFEKKFTSRVETYRKDISGLDFFSDNYSEQRKRIAERFIEGLLQDLSESIRSVTGADLGIINVLMGVIRDAIMGVATQTTSFILRESLLTAVKLPGDLAGVFVSKLTQDVRGIFEGTGFNFSQIGRDLDTLGQVVTGVLSWIYLTNINKAVTVEQTPGGIPRPVTHWDVVGKSLASIAMMMMGNYMFSKHDILSSAVGLSEIAMGYMLYGKKNINARGILSVLGLQVATQIADQFRRSNISAHYKYGLSALEGGLSAGALAFLFGLTNPLGLLLMATGGGLLGMFGEFLHRRQIKTQFEEQAFSFVKSKKELLSDTEHAVMINLKNIWTTLGGEVRKDTSFYKANREVLDNLSKIIARTQQMSNLYSISMIEAFKPKFEKISGEKRAEEIVKEFYASFSNIFSKFASEIKPLKEGEKPGKGIKEEDIRTKLKDEIERIIGKPIDKLSGEQRTVVENLLNTATRTMSENLKSLQVMKTGIGSILQQVQPQLAWKQIQDIWYQKPTKVEPIKDISDIQRYVQQLRKALSEFVETFKKIPSNIQNSALVAFNGQVPFNVVRENMDKLAQMLIQLAKSPEGAKKLAPHWGEIQKLTTPESQFPLLLSTDIRKKWFETFNRNFLGEIYSENQKLFRERLETGIKQLSLAHPVTNLKLEILNQKVKTISKNLGSAGQELISSILNLSKKISEISNSIHPIPIPETATISRYNRFNELANVNFESDRGTMTTKHIKIVSMGDVNIGES